MIRVVLSFIVAILVSTSALMLRAQTKTAVSPANSVSAPEAVRTASGQSAVASDEFVIGPGDVLAINVWKETEISKVVPVRSDGRISLPLIGELQSGGLTPRQLEAEITTRLKDYVADPSVTVVVQEIHSKSINVLGMVARPGLYPLTKTMTVVDAIANAGGFRDFAKQKSIYILRQNPDGTQARLPFNYKEVIKGVNPSQNVKLQPGDNIVVP
jgi:polysaccharide biosynthesis/export protein